MLIQQLSSPTIRAIGSSQAITSPASVVKELVENALDARATAVHVEISANTLDVVQCRDNGHGIAPQDRVKIAQHHCTSKIRSFEDLKGAGGETLGFRGEALACIAEVSEALVVTTRVEGEAVAAKLEIERDGKIKREEPASHSVGTTVRVTNLLAAYPVRHQAALKEPAKRLQSVRRLLQAYALSRPNIRLSLRVLKAKNNKFDFSYAPKPGGGIEDAVLKILGKDCAKQCQEAMLKSQGYELRAFLPRPDADLTKISGFGQFVAIDSRPVSARRGFGKHVVAIFKERLLKGRGHASNIKEPFLWINITCPPRSYDVNIEPAKDDVIFEEPASALQALEELFVREYPITTASSPDERATASTRHGDTLNETFNQGQLDRQLQAAETNSSSQWISIMYDQDETDLHQGSPDKNSMAENQIDSLEDEEGTVQGVHLSNPWVIARINAACNTSSRPSQSNKSPVAPSNQRRDLEPNGRPIVVSKGYAAKHVQPLLSPQTSSPVSPGSSCHISGTNMSSITPWNMSFTSTGHRISSPYVRSEALGRGPAYASNTTEATEEATHYLPYPTQDPSQPSRHFDAHDAAIPVQQAARRTLQQQTITPYSSPGYRQQSTKQMSLSFPVSKRTADNRRNANRDIRQLVSASAKQCVQRDENAPIGLSGVAPPRAVSHTPGNAAVSRPSNLSGLRAVPTSGSHEVWPYGQSSMVTGIADLNEFVHRTISRNSYSRDERSIAQRAQSDDHLPEHSGTHSLSLIIQFSISSLAQQTSKFLESGHTESLSTVLAPAFSTLPTSHELQAWGKRIAMRIRALGLHAAIEGQWESVLRVAMQRRITWLDSQYDSE